MKSLASELQEIIDAELQSVINANGKQNAEKYILLVDDDVTFLQMMQSWLGTNYKVAVARSGGQALGYLVGHRADLILLDYDMPGMTGPDVLEALRRELSTACIPVIFLTGKNDRDSVMSVMSLKPDGYILKSTSKEEILATLSKFFETRTM